MQTYKKAWFFVKTYKNNVIFTIIMLIIAQAMIVLNPIVTKNLLDNYITGVDKPWIEVQENNDERTIEYEGMYLKQERYLDEDDVVLGDITLYVDDTGYYLLDGYVENPTSEQLAGNIIDKDDTNLFFSPFINNIIILVVLMLILYTIQILSSYFQRITSALLNAKVSRDARLMAMDRINFMNLSEVEAQPAGKLANRVIGDAMGMPQLIMSLINSYLSAILSLTFTLVAMLFLVPQLGLLLIVIIPVIYFWTIRFNKHVNNVAEKINETNSLMVAKINEIINGISILKIFNTKEKTIQDFEEINNQFVDESISESKLHLGYGWNAISLLQGIIGATIIIIFGFFSLQSNNSLDAGLILIFYTYSTRLLSPFIVLFQQFSIIEHAKVKTERYYKIINSEQEDREIVQIEPAKGEIIFDDVNFGYVKDKLILKNISFKIKPDQKVGLVGHTGSGKSTLMNLLMRFNDLDEKDGKILIDGESINKYTKRTYRQNIGIILQEPVLFSTTLRENILFGETRSDEEIIDVLEEIGAHDLLEKFDNGLDEEISARGGNLSLGEKQLISFARILIKNPPIIIMDEATANIDIETELKVQHALNVVSKGRTLIVIAHRLSTIVDSDLIAVLSEGHLIEKGNHNQLIEMDGYYANMYRSQIS